MSCLHSRRNFLQSSLITGAALASQPLLSHALSAATTGAAPKPNFPVSDYHVHLSNTLTIDQALQLAKDRGV